MKPILLIAACIIGISTSVLSQSKVYYSVAGEMIFSFAAMEDQGQEASSLMRWAPVFNIQGFVNSDLSQNLGIFSGLAIRNVGYIYDDYQDPDPLTDITYKKKFRTYNLAIPVGLKFGNLSKMYFYGGYEIEFPFHYKEKTFFQGEKLNNKVQDWFSKRTESFQHGLLAGIQFSQGINLKFKYYFSEFHNQGFTDSAGVKPYEGLKSNVFYFSLSYDMFKDVTTLY